MDRDRICQFQLLQLLEAVLDTFSLIILHGYQLRKGIDLANAPKIPVEHAGSLVHRDAAAVVGSPLNLVIVLDLHDLVAHTKRRLAILFFRLFCRWRI